jgi:hypothetical protein
MILRLAHRFIPARLRPFGYLEHVVQTRTGGSVRSGPFAGMRYLDFAVGSSYAPKLLGIYERELHECVERACAMNFSLVVDLGAAEGYYAIGFARRNPHARVIAFEAQGAGREALRRMSELNGVVGQVEIEGRCDVASLRGAMGNATGCLIICDVEGEEDTLLRPDLIPSLAHAHLIVEMHDASHPGITERVTSRFVATHWVSRIWPEPRQPSDFPYRTLVSALLPTRYLDWIVSERSAGSTSWLWIEPRCPLSSY